MFGITPMPIYDPKQEISYLREFMIFFKPGDIVKFKPVNREEYDAAVEAVDAGRYDPLIREVSFSLDDFHADPTGTNAKLLGGLHGA
jgi:urea carboxylase